MDDNTDPSIEGEPGRSDWSGRRGRREATGPVAACGPNDEPTGEATDEHEALSISCDDCSMQCTAACDDCVVTFLVGCDDDDDSLVLDLDQARVVRLLGNAGLVPDLKYRVAG